MLDGWYFFGNYCNNLYQVEVIKMGIRVADQAWIGAALLHREHPEKDDFRTEEVLRRATREFGPLPPGVRQHLGSHAVASSRPSPGRYKMFTRTAHGRVRLFRTGDPVHPERTGKSLPEAGDLPPKYQELLRWYEGEYASRSTMARGDSSPKAFLAFIGLIPAYDLKLIEQAIEDDCERIEPDAGEDNAA
jgi:hypothetical protein